MKTLFFTLLASLALLNVAFGQAPSLNSGNAEQNYRHRSYRAYLPHSEFTRITKTKNYSSFENPTGIFFEAGESVNLTVSGSAGQKLTLIVHDFEQDGKHAEYPLHEGRNTLRITHRGLGYLDYRSATPDQAPAVRVDIEGGQVNGVFTRQDDAATWKRLLQNAKCNILDMLGDRCQLTYDVESLRTHCPESGPELLALYDEIIRLEQEDILGWRPTDNRPANHIHGRVQWRGFMHADGMGAAFHVSTLAGLANPDRLRQAAWGVAHEFGHVNQTRPAMYWSGMGEVSNNIFSAWVNYKLNPGSMRLEHEYIGNTENTPMIGGRFDCYINNALVRRRLWQFHGGPDDGNRVAPTRKTSDHFVSVCPLWQLQLYMAVVCGKADFYPTIFRQARATDDSALKQGELRVLFFKRACDAARLDLSEFFVKLGMLAPMDRVVEDYSSRHVTITPAMCREAIAYASRYPKPDTRVLYYITADNAGIFASKSAIRQPGADFAPTPVAGKIEIPANRWENAVAFEAYAHGELVRICLRGLNHADHCSTTVICPPGTDSVKAVQWDGARYTVWEAAPANAAPQK